jgi:hypothetical protein
MANTKTVKNVKLKPFEKLLTIMVHGKPVTIDEIESTLGNEIHMYRLSTYIWHIKTFANGAVKAIKDGRKVTAYQIINVSEVKQYMKSAGVTASNFVPGQTQKITRGGAKVATKTKTVATTKPVKTKTVKPATKLQDLKAQPVQKQVEVPVVEEILDNVFDSEVNDIINEIRDTIVD